MHPVSIHLPSIPEHPPSPPPQPGVPSRRCCARLISLGCSLITCAIPGGVTIVTVLWEKGIVAQIASIGGCAVASLACFFGTSYCLRKCPNCLTPSDELP